MCMYKEKNERNHSEREVASLFAAIFFQTNRMVFYSNSFNEFLRFLSTTTPFFYLHLFNRKKKKRNPLKIYFHLQDFPSS